MKSTVFTFRLRVRAENSDDQLQDVRDKLLSFEGVTDVAREGTLPFIDLKISVTIRDFAAAKRLHRKIDRLLSGSDAISVTTVATRMTDIVD